jgi:hypothetical protein
VFAFMYSTMPNTLGITPSIWVTVGDASLGSATTTILIQGGYSTSTMDGFTVKVRIPIRTQFGFTTPR